MKLTDKCGNCGHVLNVHYGEHGNCSKCACSAYRDDIKENPYRIHANPPEGISEEYVAFLRAEVYRLQNLLRAYVTKSETTVQRIKDILEDE